MKAFPLETVFEIRVPGEYEEAPTAVAVFRHEGDAEKFALTFEDENVEMWMITPIKQEKICVFPIRDNQRK